MKKRLLWVMLGLLVTSMLFAAGANEKSVNEQTQNGPVNLVWAGWSGEEEATKDIFQKMRSQYEASSGNTVTWVGWTWANTAQ